MDCDPEIVVGVVGDKDDFEQTTPAIDTREVGAIAIDEQRQTGVAKRSQQLSS